MTEPAPPATPDPAHGATPPQEPMVVREPLEDGRTVVTYELSRTSTIFSGPLPPPEVLKAYQQLDPTFPERLMARVEEEGRHRRQLENRVLESHLESSRSRARGFMRGQIFALVTSLTALGVATAVTLAGYPVPGGIIGGSTVVGLVTAFVVGQAAIGREEE